MSEELDKQVKKTGRPKKETVMVTHKQLVALVAETSGYAQYEIDDIINHYVYHIANKLRDQDLPVEVKKIGMLKPSIWTARMRYSPLKKKMIFVPDRRAVSFKTSPALRRTLNIKPEDTNEETN